MARVVFASFLVLLISACAALRGPPAPNSFVVFFVPGTVELAPEAQQIVREAAANAQRRRTSKIEIAVPPDMSGSMQLVEGRIVAIQNILATAGIDPSRYVRATLSGPEAMVAGAVNRAEIHLIP